MLNKIAVGKRVRVLFTSGSFGVEGNVEGIERNDDDSVSGILLRSPNVSGFELLDLDKEVLGRPGFSVEILGERHLN